MAEVADAFGTNDVFGPLGCHKAVELVNVEGWTAIIDKGADTVLFSLTLIVMMMVVMPVLMLMFLVPVLMFVMFMLVLMPMFMLMFFVLFVVMMMFGM